MSAFDRVIASGAVMAHQIDALLLALLIISGITVTAVSAAIVGFCIRYRRGSLAARDHVMSRNPWLELSWTVIPLLLFFGLFFWGAWLYARLFSPPADALQVAIVARQWMWKAQHPQGQREIDALHIPAGRDIELALTSEDVIHSFFVPAFRVKQDVLPGRYVHLWFRPTRIGRYRLLCAEYCGSNHSRMRGTITVMAPADYERWLRRHPGPASMAAQGEALFRNLGCSGCHGASATIHAPKLEGVFGNQVSLQGGNSVIADAQYVRDSILTPAKDVSAGYAPIMPSFEGQLSEEQILQLIAYIQSLAAGTGSKP